MIEQELLAGIGEKIKQIRRQQNMTQNKLANECKFEKASMSRIESGQTNVTVRTLNRISSALHVEIADFFRNN